MKRVMLYFGSFNPIHKGHTALAEYVLDSGLCDEVVLVVSPRSPYKEEADLAPEMDRFEMAEIACADSKYPEKIKDIRGVGLLIGIEIEESISKAVFTALFENKYLTSLCKNTIRIAPPLIIEKNDIDGFLDTLERILK